MLRQRFTASSFNSILNRTSTAMMNSMVSRLSMPKESIGADIMSSFDIALPRGVLSTPVNSRKISTQTSSVSSVMESHPDMFGKAEGVVAGSKPHLAERETQGYRHDCLGEA